uniref:Uncharacterized protein n=1 Tax=Arundo donax TaxID=35708 RepID=A0A0A8Y410_ARUDO
MPTSARTIFPGGKENDRGWVANCPIRRYRPTASRNK